MRDVMMTIIVVLLIAGIFVMAEVCLHPSRQSVPDDRPVWLDHATMTTTYIGDSEINMCITIPRAHLSDSEIICIFKTGGLR